MNEFLTWGLPIAAALALFALTYNQLEVASRSGDYQMAKVWFGLGTATLALRIIYWGFSTNRGLMLRLFVCIAACGALVALIAETFRSINHKRGRWLNSNRDVQPLLEEEQWHETATYDLTPRREAQTLATSQSEPNQSIATGRATTEPKPNLVHLRSYFKPAYLFAGNVVNDSRRTITRGLPSLYAPGPEEVIAIITEVRNETVRGHKVAFVGDVVAHIRYTTFEGVLIGEVNRAPWLTKEYDHTWFDVGGARRLLIGIISRENKVVALDNYFISAGHYECVGAYLNAERFYARVCLIADGEQKATYTIWVDLTTDPPICADAT